MYRKNYGKLFWLAIRAFLFNYWEWKWRNPNGRTYFVNWQLCFVTTTRWIRKYDLEKIVWFDFWNVDELNDEQIEAYDLLIEDEDDFDEEEIISEEE